MFTMLTELQAVNEMLETVNESPVNSLTPPISEETALAQKILRKVSEDVQMRGWWFNTDIKQTLAPNNDGDINLSDNTLKLLASPHIVDVDGPVLRGTRVYSQARSTYTWTKSLTDIMLVRFLEWDLLPQEARVYISQRAARYFAKKVTASENVIKEAGAEELRAYDELMRSELRQSRPNALVSPSTIEVAYR